MTGFLRIPITGCVPLGEHRVYLQRTDHRVVTIALLMATVLFLNYFVAYTFDQSRAFYRMLFYLPLVFGTLWFAVTGAVVISTGTFLICIPLAMQHLKGFAANDLQIIGEASIYAAVAVVLASHVRGAEKQRRASMAQERLSVIGRTVVEVAHDMRAPLVAIGGFTTQVSRNLGAGQKKNRDKLEIVVREASRLDDMVREMLDFGKPVEIHPVETSLNDLVLESVQLARSAAESKGVELVFRPARSLPAVFVDQNRMKQVILNLLTNAVQASSKGSRVTVVTHARDRWNVSLDIVDEGIGIDEKDRERIFLPFYTTKKNGTGLGLPIVKKMVEVHGGELRLKPNKGDGVTFTVRFPVVPARARSRIS